MLMRFLSVARRGGGKGDHDGAESIKRRNGFHQKRRYDEIRKHFQKWRNTGAGLSSSRNIDESHTWPPHFPRVGPSLSRRAGASAKSIYPFPESRCFLLLLLPQQTDQMGFWVEGGGRGGGHSERDSVWRKNPIRSRRMEA